MVTRKHVLNPTFSFMDTSFNIWRDLSLYGLPYVIIANRRGAEITEGREFIHHYNRYPAL